ncbi:MAG: hypothetical protein ACK5BC_03820, partial [Burkholderiales bacterium]
MEHSQPPRQRCHRTRLHGSLVNVVVVLISIIPLGVEVSPRFFSLAGAGRQVIRARIIDRSKHYRLLIE